MNSQFRTCKALPKFLRRLESELTQPIFRGALIEGKSNIVSYYKETFAATACEWCVIDIDSLEWDDDT